MPTQLPSPRRSRVELTAVVPSPSVKVIVAFKLGQATMIKMASGPLLGGLKWTETGFKSSTRGRNPIPYGGAFTLLSISKYMLQILQNPYL